jgi:hypothetical protein
MNHMFIYLVPVEGVHFFLNITDGDDIPVTEHARAIFEGMVDHGLIEDEEQHVGVLQLSPKNTVFGLVSHVNGAPVNIPASDIGPVALTAFDCERDVTFAVSREDGKYEFLQLERNILSVEMKTVIKLILSVQEIAIMRDVSTKLIPSSA